MGHHAGADLLKSFASRLKDIFAGDGVVARLGGDEFAILIENVESRQQLADLANRALTIRETLFAAGRSEVHPTAHQSLMSISYAVICLKKQTTTQTRHASTT